jgi:RNA recognition motif. (a.k.a. RRM, RBD, or RNP domain)
MFIRVFGLTNLATLREGKVGRECRGEEHVVEVVRNKTSGKIRIYWNSSNITHLFRQRYIPDVSILEYSWKTRSGEALRIVGNVGQNPAEDSTKFEFFVDGTNFTNLPTVGQLGRNTDQVKEGRSPHDDTGSQRSLDSSIATNDPDADHSSDMEQGFRLSMVGLNSMTSGEDEVNDELHSDLYSNSLSSLRSQIVTYLPQTEEMVSRAIINAFFVEAQSSPLSFSFRSLDKINHCQVEADFILEAFRWARLNVDVAPRSDVEDLGMQFLQKCIDNIFLLIRNEELNSDEAARVVYSVAAILRLKFANDIAQDTIILNDLAPGTTTDDLREALSPFGEIEAVSISSISRTFGYCRYVSLDAIRRIMVTMEGGSFVINDKIPTITSLCSNSFDSNHYPRLLTLPDDVNIEPLKESKCDDGSETSVSVVARSPPHLMGPLSYSPDSIIRKFAIYEFVEDQCEMNIHQTRYNPASAAACY